jgi:hypothetical protein
MLFRIIFFSFVLLFTTGCVKTPSPQELAPHLNVKKKQEISLAILDHRPYVLKNEMKSSYIGTIRSTFGIPYRYYTIDDKPLSDYLSETLALGFSESGQNITIISTLPDDSTEHAKVKLFNTKTKSILMEINEWQFQYYAFVKKNTHKVTVAIYSKDGDEIFSRNYYGTAPYTNVLWIHKENLEKIFSDYELIDALNR